MNHEPLPLTPFEELLLWEDRRSYPWTILVRLRFEGCLDRAALEGALSRALDRHPLLRSRIERRGGGWVWVASEPAVPVVWSDVPGPPPAAVPRGLQIDLKSDIGLRAIVTAGAQETDVVLHVHHACCDGLGLFSFINDLLILYAGRRDPGAAELPLPACEAGRLARRGRYGLNGWKLLAMLPRQLVGLQGAAQFLFRKPTPIVHHVARPDDDETPPEYPATARHECTVQETVRLREIARQRQVTSNDLLARDLFLTLAQWRRELGRVDERDWLRMMLPMNLRLPDDDGLPAANVISSVFLDRRGEDAGDPDRLLQSIHDEMQLIKRNRLGFTFLFSLRICQWLPGGLRKMVRRDKCTISCIFTNVGKLLSQCPLPLRDGRRVAGDVVLGHVQALAPLRPYSCISLSTHQYADRQVFDLHYDPGVITADQARRLMELFVGQLQQSLAPV